MPLIIVNDYFSSRLETKEEIKLTFLGTGTSQGVPVITCECEVCKSTDPRDNRLRTSVLIETQGVCFSIDSGPDFRQQMLNANVKHLDAILFTHEHKDHIAGMDDVRAFNFRSNNPMEIFCSKRVYDNLCREFHYVFDPAFQYPGIPKVNTTIIENKTFSIKGVNIKPIEVLHYRLPVFGYRIGNLSYITDANQIVKEEFEKMKGTEVLVINALRREHHVSHFTLAEALAIIEVIQPKKAYLIHLSHYMGLHADVSKELPENVEVAYDGLVITC